MPRRGPRATAAPARDAAPDAAPRAKVIGASRAWISLHDTFGVRIADGFDDALGLALVIAIEQMERPHAAPPMA